MKVVIDRFEGDFALVEMEDKTILPVPKTLFLPLSPKEGDVVDISIDRAETQSRLQKNDARLKALFRRQ